MEVLAIIPARGGSKGLPRKNVLPLANHPLIAYSIKAAQESKLISRLLVNTDAAYIRDVAKSYGASVFDRPKELGGDLVTDFDVFKHMLLSLKESEGYAPDLIVQLRPTSPVRPVGLVDACIEKLIHSAADSLRVVTKAPQTPYKMWRIQDENEPMVPLLTLTGIDEPYNQPRQMLPDIYWQIGCLDVIRPHVIMEQNSMSGKNILPYVLSSQYAIDIDDFESFKNAEAIIYSGNCIRFEG